MSKKQKQINAQMRTAIALTKLVVSDWSSPNSPPSKVGVYEIRPEYTTPHRMYAYWNGSNWGFENQDVADAFMLKDDARTNQQVTWRGIVK